MKAQPDKKATQNKYRTLSGPYRSIVSIFTAVSILVSIVQIFHIVVAGQVLQSKSYLAVLMACLVPLIFISIPASKRSRRDTVPWYDLLCAILILVCAIYVAIHAVDIQLKGWSIRPPTLALYLYHMLDSND